MENQQLTPIGRVAEAYGISTRTLRYYEQTGLLPASGKTAAGYRLYGPDALARLRQILVLRRLRVPLKEVAAILENPAGEQARQLLRQNIVGLQGEMDSLARVRDILAALLARLESQSCPPPAAGLLQESEAEALLALLPPVDKQVKEAPSMSNQAPAPYREGDVRIVYLPPFTVASAHRPTGPEPEEATRRMIEEFVRSSGLAGAKPDLRSFGFNHPNPTEANPQNGYERWVTIPEAWEVPTPLTKKQFPGGLYAARTIPFGSFEEWGRLHAWVLQSDEYLPRMAGEEVMFGLMEEELDYIHLYTLPPEEQLKRLQLDLLFPVERRT